LSAQALLLLLGHASIWRETHFGKGLLMLKTYGRKRPSDFGWEHAAIVELLVVRHKRSVNKTFNQEQPFKVR
jgi:hypothetical protein